MWSGFNTTTDQLEVFSVLYYEVLQEVKRVCEKTAP